MPTSPSPKRDSSPDSAPATSPGSDGPGTDTSGAARGSSNAPQFSPPIRPSDLSDEQVAELSDRLGMKVFRDPPHPPRDPHDDKDMAGVYELDCTLWDEPIIVLAANPFTGTLSEQHRAIRHLKGDMVSLGNVEARRLLAAGAVVHPGERERQAAAAAYAAQEAATAAAKMAEERLREVEAITGDPETSAEAVWKAGVAQGPQPSVAPSAPPR